MPPTPSLPGVQTLDRRSSPAAGVLDRSTPTVLWTKLTPAERQQFRGFLSPLLKLAPVDMAAAWTWDQQWRGASVEPRISFNQTTPGRGTGVQRLYKGDPNATFEVFDARDRLMCGAANCNPPFQTWMAVQPDSRQQYCSPDTLISVMFQVPRYNAAQAKLRAALLRVPGGFSPDVNNWPADRKARYLALNPGPAPREPVRVDSGPPAGIAAYREAMRVWGDAMRVWGARVEAQRDNYYSQINEMVSQNASAWASWASEVDSLCRLAMWSSNIRVELFYDWIDPDYFREERAGSAVTRSTTRVDNRSDIPMPFTRFVQSFGGPREHFGASLGGVFSSHLWQANNRQRNASRWFTHRYPLSATLYRRGNYDQGYEGATDLPDRRLPFRLPVDERYFIADNTVPVPVWSQEGSNPGFWGCFSADGWKSTPGESTQWLPIPGVADGLLTLLEDSTADEYVRRTVASLEKFFLSGVRGGAFDGSPVSREMVPLYVDARDRNKIKRARYMRQETSEGEPRYDAEPLPEDRQWVYVPSPASYVLMLLSRAEQIKTLPFTEVAKRGMYHWLNISKQLQRRYLIPVGVNLDNTRSMAAQAFQGELDTVGANVSIITSSYATILGIINAGAGLVAATIGIVINYIATNLQELKLARGTNPLTLPMATSRYIAADPSGAISECDFSGSATTYDDLIPQVRLIAESMRTGNTDALRLFTELGKAVDSPEVQDQERAFQESRREAAQEQVSTGGGGGGGGGGAAPVVVGAALVLWLLMRGQK